MEVYFFVYIYIAYIKLLDCKLYPQTHVYIKSLQIFAMTTFIIIVFKKYLRIKDKNNYSFYERGLGKVFSPVTIKLCLNLVHKFLM